MAAPGLEALALLAGACAGLLALAGTAHAARAALAAQPRVPVRAPGTAPSLGEAAATGAEAGAEAGGWTPPVTVIVPCRGEHPGFEANVAALLAQDYPRFEVLFAVDEPDDPCARALTTLDPGLRVVRSDPAVVGPGWASGKIVAQLSALRHADPASEVIVFADADARPGRGWLRALVAPLADPATGAVTGYRWYHPAGRATFWTALRDAWNAVGLDAMTMPRFRFLWGGSMAVRRADFDRAPVAKEWRRHVSEDVGLTRAVRSLGLGIAFAPGAVVASPEDGGRAEVLEWVVRQTALTRTAMPNLYAFATAVYAASGLSVLLGLALLVAAAGPPASPGLALAGALLLTPVASALPRAWLRERMVRAAVPELRHRPRGERAAQLALSLILPVFMLWALAAAWRTHRIAWRGRTYSLAPRPDEQAGEPSGGADTTYDV